MTAANSQSRPASRVSRPDAEATRILQKLTEPGACLAVAQGMENGVIVRGAKDVAERMDVVNRGIAEAMALKNWIACSAAGRVSRYRITATGRAMVRGMDERREEKHCPTKPSSIATQEPRPSNVEAPLILLSRRRNPDGTLFLSPEQVAAGERLREDFELAQLGAPSTRDWERFFTACAAPQPTGFGEAAARFDTADTRVADALHSLGPGLGDVTLRCCCLLEGMESTERRMGWSARSGKIVLRIALQRLADHYAAQGDAGRMIG